MSPVEARATVSYLSGRPLQSRLGVGYAAVGAVDVGPALSPSLEVERDRKGHVVFLEPEIVYVVVYVVVYEIAFDGVQRSTRYPGGVALRFARVKRHRDDKTPEDVDTIDDVRRHLR